MYLSIVHDEYLVAGEHRVEAMGDGEHRAVLESLADRVLHQTVGLAVDGRRRLVQHYDARVAQDGARHAHQLALSHAEVLAVLHNLALKLFRELFNL